LQKKAGAVRSRYCQQRVATCLLNHWGAGDREEKLDRLVDALQCKVLHCMARRSGCRQQGSGCPSCCSVKQILTRCCSWTAAIWDHLSGSWSTGAGQKSDETIRRVIAFACGGGAQSRACRVGGVSGGGVCQGGVVGEHVVSRTGCLRLAQFGRSSLRVVHERLSGVVVVLVLPYVCWIGEVQVSG
jgi:hypothetical protein